MRAWRLSLRESLKKNGIEKSKENDSNISESGGIAIAQHQHHQRLRHRGAWHGARNCEGRK
jgi:hypothetical protein